MRTYLRQVQENFEWMAILSDEAGKERGKDLIAQIQAQGFTKDIRLVTKEDAAVEFMGMVGENFLELLDGINPMRANLRIRLKADYLQADSLQKAQQYLAALPGIIELKSPEKEIAKIQKNTLLVVRIASVLALVVVILAWFLIGGTIRLAVFSKRFSIRTMQLIGARNRLIRRPFIGMGVLQGFLGGLIASGAFFALASWLSGWDTRLALLREILYSLEGMIMLAGIIIFGALLGLVSSTAAVNRFLNQPLEKIV